MGWVHVQGRVRRPDIVSNSRKIEWTKSAGIARLLSHDSGWISFLNQISSGFEPRWLWCDRHNDYASSTRPRKPFCCGSVQSHSLLCLRLDRIHDDIPLSQIVLTVYLLSFLLPPDIVCLTDIRIMSTLKNLFFPTHAWTQNLIGDKITFLPLNHDADRMYINKYAVWTARVQRTDVDTVDTVMFSGCIAYVDLWPLVHSVVQ